MTKYDKMKYAMNQSYPSDSRPQVDQAREAIKHLLLTGQMGPSGKIPSLRNLAAKLGFGRDPVWRALQQLIKQGLLDQQASNGRLSISSKVMEDMSRPLHLLFVTDGIDHVTHPIFQRCFDAMLRQGREMGIEVTMQLLKPGESLTQEMVRGYDCVAVSVIFYAQSPDAREFDIPMVGINTLASEPYTHHLRSNSFVGGQMAARILIQRGYHRVGILHISEKVPNIETYEQRYLGFQEAWLTAGRSLGDLRVHRSPYRQTLLQIYRQLEPFLENHQDIDAVFGLEDRHAICAADIFTNRGVKIPDEIGILGFDGGHSAKLHHPTLSSIRQEMECLGKMLILNVRTLVKNPINPPLVQKIDPTFMPGQTLKNTSDALQLSTSKAS